MIIIDSNEASKNEELVEQVMKTCEGEVDIQSLPVGDIIVGKLVIERKTPSDFRSSVDSDRIWKQCAGMDDQEDMHGLVYVETNDFWRDIVATRHVSKYEYPKMVGAICKIYSEFESVSVTYMDREEFLQHLKTWDKQTRKDTTPSVKVTSMKRTVEQRKMDSITCISGISTKKSRKLFEEFGSLQSLAEASLEEVKQVSGIGDKLGENIYEFYR